ncbi:MAG: portal protein [Pseudomonadota bacterium]|nr:portal protein [Pseudomonadota bacterium]
MAARSALSEKETKDILSRIAQARADRWHFAPAYNDFLELARPHRQRVAKDSLSTPRPTDEQNDLFDTTLQDVVDDFASDMLDEFTPSYKPWTKHVPTAAVRGPAQKRQVNDYVDQRMKALYDEIRRSSFEEASQELWIDLAIGPSAIEIGYSEPGRPVSVEHVPINELLIRPGPYGGVDDRFRERIVKVSHLDTIWPELDWTDFGATKEMRALSKATAVVVTGGFRDWSKSDETWNWHVIANSKVLRRREYTGSGSCPLIVGRVAVSSPTAYGVGPGIKAIAPARTLNELNYLFLKKHGRDLNPPYVFYDDGLLNPEGGIDDGTWLPASENFKVMPLVTDQTGREVWFQQEDLRMMIRRALFQDKPYQRGDTPPTALQWASEEAMSARRMSFPRARLHEEFVLPVIRRFEWIMQRRGQIDPLKIEGEIVNIEPVSPLSRAADLEEANRAIQFLQGVGTVMPNALMRIDEGVTMNAIKQKMGADLVEVLSDEAWQQKMAVVAQTGGQTE